MKEQLQSLRKSKCLTQDEFSEIIGVKLTTYQKYERDVISPTYETLIKIADFYGVTTDYLLGRNVEKEHDVITLLSIKHRLTENEKKLLQAYFDIDQEERQKFSETMMSLIEKLHI